MNKQNYKSTFDLHYGASINIQEKAKQLRKNMTNAEKFFGTNSIINKYPIANLEDNTLLT